MRAAILLLALTISLWGCADTEPVPASRDASADAAAAANRDAPRPQATGRPSAPVDVAQATPAPTPAATSKLALDGDGLRVFDVASGSARAIPFGTTKPEALRLIGSVLAAGPTLQGENLDCRATLATWANGLTVWFTDERFVGWSLGADRPTLTTAAGLTVGSTRTELESAYAADIAPSTLGLEFSAGGLAGLLAGGGADARVTHLWAGNTCVAR